MFAQVIYPMPLWYYVNSICHNLHIFPACADSPHKSDVPVCWFIWRPSIILSVNYYIIVNCVNSLLHAEILTGTGTVYTHTHTQYDSDTHAHLSVANGWNMMQARQGLWAYTDSHSYKYNHTSPMMYHVLPDNV